MKNIILFLVFVALTLPGNAQTVNGIGDGLAAYENIQAMPYLYPAGTNVKQYSTYDRYGGNIDFSWNPCVVLYTLDNGEAVIFDEYGPGCLYKHSMSILVDHPDRLNNHIRFYFDDEASPGIDMTIGDYFGGKVVPFNAPFGFMDSIPNEFGIRFEDQYYPLRFKKHLVITIVPNETWDAMDASVGACGFTCHLFQPGYQLESWKGITEDNQHVRYQWNNLGKDPKDTTGNIEHSGTLAINDNKTSVILNLDGPGSLASIKFSLEPYNKATFFSTYIRIFWDGTKKPDIDIPLGDFFGSSSLEGQGGLPGNAWPQTIQNLMFGYNGQAHTMYMYWPMPFWSGAKIEIVNKSGSVITLNYEIQEKPRNVYNYQVGSAGYFFAKKSHIEGAYPANTLFECTGQGQVVARTFYATEAISCENDEFTYIDGVLTPQIHGTGTEDDYCQGWNGSAYNKPLWGALTYGYQNAYRIYLGERYVFYNHIKIQSEGTGYDPDKIKVSQVVYLYKKADGVTGLSLTDSVDVGNQASEKAHSYSVSKQTWTGTTSDHYDGYMDDIDHYAITDDGRAFNGYCQFTVNINPNNKGVKLRKRLNTSLNGLQRANVYVDGVKIDRPWQIATASKQPGMQCWRDDDFEIPYSFTIGKNSLTIKIEYVASPQNGSINEYFYWVMSYSYGISEGSVTATPPAMPSNLSEEMIVYPNPATDNLYINNSNYAYSIIMILDLQGKQVLIKQIDSEPIDISNLNKGIYVVKLVGSDNVMITKFIKE
jgi:hypothetical protein